MPAQTQVRESAETYTLPDTYTPANGNTRDVDEYNRRHRFGEPLPEDTVGTTVEEEGEWDERFPRLRCRLCLYQTHLAFLHPVGGNSREQSTVLGLVLRSQLHILERLR